MGTSDITDVPKLLDESNDCARIRELEEEKAKQEALLAENTAKVEALKAYKEMLEALLRAKVGDNRAQAA